MKAVALIGMLVTMLLVVYLTLSNLKSKPIAPSLESDSGTFAPVNLSQLPSQVKNKLNEAMERNAAEKKAAEDALKFIGHSIAINTKIEKNTTDFTVGIINNVLKGAGLKGKETARS